MLESNLNIIIGEIESEIVGKLTGQKLSNFMKDITGGILRTIKKRIHSDGRSAGGMAIGSYSEKPIYVNPSRGAVSVSLPNEGKHGKVVFDNGKKHKTRYYSSGYKDWRKANNRATNKVNLEFKGDLRRSFTFSGGGKVFNIGFNDNKNFEKHQGLEAHFGQDIWGIGKQEKELIDKSIEFYLK